MDLPRKHHFNPAFYLSQWTGDDNQLCEMRLIRGDVKPRRRYPHLTGYVRDLYRTAGVSEVESQDLEIKFMTPLDTVAAAALQGLLSGDSPNLQERVAWTRFVLSLIYRNPDAVKLIKTHMATLVDEITASLEAKWAAEREVDDEQTLAEATAIRQPGFADIHGANMVADIIGNHSAVPDIVRMNWGKINLSDSKVPLVTSDRPVLMVNLSDPEAFIALPIGPYDLFVAAFNDRLSRLLHDSTKLAQTVNRDVIANAREFVWGVDDGEIDVVRTWIGANPDRIILSREQQEAGIAAARGLSSGSSD
jgi:hypothetical protein